MKNNNTLAIVLPLGLMLFSFFFGAGNLIFPPILGQFAGENVGWAALGFCLSGVGFPLLGIMSMAVNHFKDTDEMLSPISVNASRLLMVLSALTIGPLFAVPRTAAVSYETGIMALLPPGIEQYGLPIYSVFFFAIVYYLSMNPSKIVDYIGKILSPLLLVCLGILIACVIFKPMGEMHLPNSMYVLAPTFKGFQEGYQTMDLLCSTMFATGVLKTLAEHNITNKADILKACTMAACIAATCLAVIYGALAYAGAVSVDALGIMANGGQLLSAISIYYMGYGGQIVLALIIFFACLTTAIGITAAISTYFYDISGHRVLYQRLVAGCTLFSLAISNFGLSNIIKFSIPVICMLYPIVIAVVVLNLCEFFIERSRIVYILCMSFTTIFALLDGIRAAGVDLHVLDAFLSAHLPFFSIGFGWIIPCFGGIALGMLLKVANRS